MGPSCTTIGPTVSSDTPVFIEGRVAMITSASFVSRSGKAERPSGAAFVMPPRPFADPQRLER